MHTYTHTFFQSVEKCALEASIVQRVNREKQVIINSPYHRLIDSFLHKYTKRNKDKHKNKRPREKIIQRGRRLTRKLPPPGAIIIFEITLPQRSSRPSLIMPLIDRPTEVTLGHGEKHTGEGWREPASLLMHSPLYSGKGSTAMPRLKYTYTYIQTTHIYIYIYFVAREKDEAREKAWKIASINKVAAKSFGRVKRIASNAYALPRCNILPGCCLFRYE